MGITSQEATVSTATVSAKGWIVIPAELRRKYHIEPGGQIRIVDYGAPRAGTGPREPDPRSSGGVGRGILADPGAVGGAPPREGA